MNNIGTGLTAMTIEPRTNKNGKVSIWDKIIGIIFLSFGILTLLVVMFEFFAWNNRKDNYIEVEAYTNRGILKYTLDDKTIEVNEITDYTEEPVILNTDSDENLKLYCDKDKLTTCIYFDKSNSIELAISSTPIIAIFSSLLLMIIGLFFIEKSSRVTLKNQISYSLYCAFLWLLSVGLSIIIWQLVNYLNNKATDIKLVLVAIFFIILSIPYLLLPVSKKQKNQL